MKFTITESEKKEILSLYQKNNLINEKIDFNSILEKTKTFIKGKIPFLRKKIKEPFVYVQETPNGKFRLWLKDNKNSNFKPVDLEKWTGPGDGIGDFETTAEAQKVADTHNATIKGTPFQSDKFINLPPELKTYQRDLKKRGYLDIVDKVGLADGTYYAEGFQPDDMALTYSDQDKKAPVNRNSRAYKIKTEGKPDHKYDTGYVVLTSKLGGDILPGVGTVSIKDGIPNSSHWGGPENIISIHKNPSIVK